MSEAAILVLADGSVFHGKALGATGFTIGEVVFNTSMTGYQSYTKQIVTLTYPHIGNTGTNNEDTESNQVYASGLIIRDLPLQHSNFRSQSSLADYLKQNNIVAISEIDTRRLTRLLRDKGAQAGCIMSGDIDEAKALELAKSFGSMAGKDLAQEVTCAEAYEWTQGEWQLGKGYSIIDNPEFHVIAYDFGVKHNILRMLAERGCKLTVVPAKTSAEAVLALNPDGIFLSNGPGDPEPCDYAIQAIQTLLQSKKPLFGICLGHQLLGLAVGGKTKKMSFGHHGANHPVQDLASQKVLIIHRSLFDNSVQGIELIDQPAFSFQGHPEASPGPNDVAYLFDKFIAQMRAAK